LRLTRRGDDVIGALVALLVGFGPTFSDSLSSSFPQCHHLRTLLQT
jgi:hypothetical protein